MSLFNAFRKKQPSSEEELEAFYADFLSAERATREELNDLEQRRHSGILDLTDAELAKLDQAIDDAGKRFRDFGSARAQIALRITAAAEQARADEMQDVANAGKAAADRQCEIFAVALPLYAKLAALSKEWADLEYERDGAYRQLETAGLDDLREMAAPALTRVRRPPPEYGEPFYALDNPLSGLHLPGFWPPPLATDRMGFAEIVKALKG